MEQLLEDWAITRWWRKSLDVFFISIPLFDIRFSRLDLYQYSSLPKPPMFVFRVPFFRTVYNVLNVNFKISGCNILQKSVILSSHERLTNDNAERHGKSWIFRFFLGQLGAFYFLRNVDPGWSNLFQSPWWRSRNIPPFLRTIYWLAGAILELGRFQAAHRNRWKLSRSKVSSSEGFLWVFFLFTMLGPRMRIVWICFHHVWSFSTWNSSPLFSLCLIFSTTEFITMKHYRLLENMFWFFQASKK